MVVFESTPFKIKNDECVASSLGCRISTSATPRVAAIPQRLLCWGQEVAVNDESMRAPGRLAGRAVAAAAGNRHDSVIQKLGLQTPRRKSHHRITRAPWRHRHRHIASPHSATRYRPPRAKRSHAMAPSHLHVLVLVVYATFVAVGSPFASSFTPTTPALIRHARKGASPTRTRRYAEAVGKILGRASDTFQTQCTCTEEVPEEAMPSVPGLPSYLDELSVGDEPIYRLRESISDDGTVEQQPYAIERVSQTPPIYVLRNFVSEEDAQIIAQSAYLSQMGQAETYADNGQQARPNSTTAFLSHDEADNPTPSAPIVDALSDEVGCWLVDADGRNCWAEPMQVVRYTESGRFVLHHDSCNRVITTLYFLNGVGGTWFPLADDDRHFPRSRDEAIDACCGAIPGMNGLLVKGIEEGYDMDVKEGYRPSTSEGTKEAAEDEKNAENVHDSAKGRTVHIHPGDAIAFYNLRWMGNIDAERFEELAKQQREAREPIAVPDWRSLHSGLPVESGRSLEKWIANHWLHVE